MPQNTIAISTGKQISNRVTQIINELENSAKKAKATWETERRALLQKLLDPTRELKDLLANTERELEPIFTRPDVRRELFKFFYGARGGYQEPTERIGKFFILPLFKLEEKLPEDESPKIELVLAWNVCTATVCYKVRFNIADGSGTGFQLRNTFLSQTEISGLTSQILNSSRISDAEQKDLEDEYVTPYIHFLDKLKSSDVLTDKLLDFLIFRYAHVHTQAEVQSLDYSKRVLPKETLTGEVTGIPHVVIGDTTYEEQNFKALMEYLFNEGYSDAVKIRIATRSYYEDYDEGEGEKPWEPRWRTKPVKFLREHFAEWYDEGKNALSDEPKNYEEYAYNI
jgi:hypothetical protein